MPFAWLKAHSDSMPVIQAQESLIGSTIAALGSGSMKKHYADRTMKSWSRLADTFSKTKKIKSKESLKMFLATSGIGFVEKHG